jgi:hypothetical protein
MDQTEAIKTLKKFIRRTKYSMGLLGIGVHAILTNLFFNSSDAAINAAHNKAGLWALIVGIILIAALIETGMWLLDIAEQQKKDGEQ